MDKKKWIKPQIKMIGIKVHTIGKPNLILAPFSVML
jgi:hypothetical protein